MWEYCPMCCSADEPTVIPVAEIDATLDDDGVESEQKNKYRVICERCGYEREFEE